MAGEGLNRVGAEFFHPFAQNVLMNVQVTGGLCHRHPALLDQLDRLNLEFAMNLRLRTTTSGFMKHLNLVSIFFAAFGKYYDGDPMTVVEFVHFDVKELP